MLYRAALGVISASHSCTPSCKYILGGLLRPESYFKDEKGQSRGLKSFRGTFPSIIPLIVLSPWFSWLSDNYFVASKCLIGLTFPYREVREVLRMLEPHEAPIYTILLMFLT